MTVRFEIQGPVAIITLARPESLNALDLDSLKLLRKHLSEFRDRDDLRAAVLTGEGKAFAPAPTSRKHRALPPPIPRRCSSRWTSPARRACMPA